MKKALISIGMIAAWAASCVFQAGSQISYPPYMIINSTTCYLGQSCTVSGSGGVSSFNTRTGAVTLQSSDVSNLGFSGVNITGSGQVTATGCTQSASIGGNCVVSGSSTSAVTFSVIPGTYQSLTVEGYGESTTGTELGIYVTYNGDTGSNYSLNGVYQSSTTAPGASAAVSQAHCQAGLLSNTGASSFKLEIPGYADTSFTKTDLSQTISAVSPSSASNIWADNGCGWNNTAVITSVTLTTSSNDFAAGTKFILWGSN
jgi:hypothetical protein